jgi:TPR repeat protein
VVLIAVSLAALLFLDSTRLLAEEERPPFLTMEDQRRCIVQDENCFNWIYQKALIGRLVRQVLIRRGFEQKSAFFIARDWDAFRYDIETGNKILPKPPMLVTTADAVEFAGRIPKCFANIATSTCQIRFASEYGCNLQRDYMPACRRQFNTVKAQFARMPTTGKDFMSWYDSEYKFYEGIACLYGPNGGDIPVFDAGPAATATKLKFDAGTEATKIAALAQSASPTSTAAAGPELTPAPMCKAVIRASHWRANDEFRDGQELPEQLQLSGLDMSNVKLVLRRRGDTPPANEPGASLDVPGLPRVDYNDLPDGWLGMELGPIEDLPTDGAILPRARVIYVAPNGPAAQAGVRKGDYVLRIGGRVVDDAMYLGLHTTEAPIDQLMNILYQRDGNSGAATLTAIDIERAGDANDLSALRYLGDFQANRRFDGPPGANPALSYYLRAAEFGDPRAMGRVATIFSASGQDTDRAEARKWYEKASGAGHVPSMRRLADMYVRGEGGPKDVQRAREWLEKGANAGDLEQMYEVVKLYRSEGESKYPEQRRWLEKIVGTPKSAIPKDGDRFVDQASFDLAIFKLHGLGGSKDLVEGRKLVERAANSGNVALAPYVFGMFLMNSDGGQDFAAARLWFERGAKGEGADPNAMWALGMIYKEGVGVAKNPVEAHKWLKMAADLGHKEAVKDLQGLPVPPPPQKKSTPKSRATPPFSPFSQ